MLKRFHLFVLTLTYWSWRVSHFCIQCVTLLTGSMPSKSLMNQLRFVLTSRLSDKYLMGSLGNPISDCQDIDSANFLILCLQQLNNAWLAWLIIWRKVAVRSRGIDDLLSWSRGQVVRWRSSSCSQPQSPILILMSGRKQFHHNNQSRESAFISPTTKCQSFACGNTSQPYFPRSNVPKIFHSSSISWQMKYFMQCSMQIICCNSTACILSIKQQYLPTRTPLNTK